MKITRVQMMTSARLPTREANFRLALYRDEVDGKEHLALIYGQVKDQENVLTRVHSECFTGDVLGSLRCDCGPQLSSALALLGQAKCGILLYLRQEGRGIGLVEKLKAYNLQDAGYDTVDANLELGHEADARDYAVAALVLKDLGVRSIDLMTNNPAKISGLESCGVSIANRVSLEIAATSHSLDYLNAKVNRMDHLISLDFLREVVASGNGSAHQNGNARSNGNGHHNGQGKQIAVPKPEPIPAMQAWFDSLRIAKERPSVTISFAQSLDGSIALHRQEPLNISGPESHLMTHQLRSMHDGILVGIDTLLADDPQLTVRLFDGPSPRPIVVDSRLRFPLTAKLLDNPQPLLIGTGPNHDRLRRRALEERGVEVIEVPEDPEGGIDLAVFTRQLKDHGVHRLMVEGGARVLASFLRCQLVDGAVVTVAPRWVGGLRSIDQAKGSPPMPQFQNPVWHQFGQDMVILTALTW